MPPIQVERAWRDLQVLEPAHWIPPTTGSRTMAYIVSALFFVHLVLCVRVTPWWTIEIDLPSTSQLYPLLSFVDLLTRTGPSPPVSPSSGPLQSSPSQSAPPSSSIPPSQPLSSTSSLLSPLTLGQASAPPPTTRSALPPLVQPSASISSVAMTGGMAALQSSTEGSRTLTGLDGWLPSSSNAPSPGSVGRRPFPKADSQTSESSDIVPVARSSSDSKDGIVAVVFATVESIESTVRPAAITTVVVTEPALLVSTVTTKLMCTVKASPLMPGKQFGTKDGRVADVYTELKTLSSGAAYGVKRAPKHKQLTGWSPAERMPMESQESNSVSIMKRLVPAPATTLTVEANVSKRPGNVS